MTTFTGAFHQEEGDQPAHFSVGTEQDIITIVPENLDNVHGDDLIAMAIFCICQLTGKEAASREDVAHLVADWVYDYGMQMGYIKAPTRH